METWVKIEEFSTLANLTREKILEMVANGEGGVPPFMETSTSPS